MFLLWCLPGAIGMFFLAIGVSRIEADLPSPVYALLSGLNAAVVGLICVAALQLSTRAITDNITRIAVIFVACAGLLYSSTWYFPVLLVGTAVSVVCWDNLLPLVLRGRGEPSLEAGASNVTPLEVASGTDQIELTPTGQTTAINVAPPAAQPVMHQEPSAERPKRKALSLRTGIIVIIGFFVIFTVITATGAALHNPPVAFKLFANLFLAGTVIFGGGPVVIPLLRQYIVAEGWVSSRDFLLGLAIIQAFPGPNFNFAVYLAALSASSASSPAIATAILGLIGIFLPGLSLATGVSSIWSKARRYRVVISALRGVHAAGVGLVWTAIYRLWQIGYLTQSSNTGTSLSLEPWWVVVAVIAFSSNLWFKFPAPVSIVVGIPLGLAWWAAVGRFKQS